MLSHSFLTIILDRLSYLFYILKNWRKCKVKNLTLYTTTAQWWRLDVNFCQSPLSSTAYFTSFLEEDKSIRHFGIVLLCCWSLGYTEEEERSNMLEKIACDTVGRILALMVPVIQCFEPRVLESDVCLIKELL